MTDVMSREKVGAGPEVKNEQPKPKPRKPRRVEVKVVRVDYGTALIEWRPKGDRVKRAYLPGALVDDKSAVTIDDLAEAEPYGVDWEALIVMPAVTVEQIATRLRQHNIWTVDDVRHDPIGARQALAEVYQAGMLQLLKCEEEI